MDSCCISFGRFCYVYVGIPYTSINVLMGTCVNLQSRFEDLSFFSFKNYIFFSAFGGNFSSFVVGDMHDACSLLDPLEKKIEFLMRTYWLEALIFLQKRDIVATCSALSMVRNKRRTLRVSIIY